MVNTLNNNQIENNTYSNLSPMNSNWFEFLGLVALRDLSFDPSEAKLASSHDGTSPLDLLKGLDAGTSPLVCSDL